MTALGNVELFYDPWKDYNDTLLGIEHNWVRPASRVITPVARPIGITVKALGTAASLAGTAATYALPWYLTYDAIKRAERKKELLSYVERARTRGGHKAIMATGEEIDISDQVLPSEKTEEQPHSRGYADFMSMLREEGRMNVRNPIAEPEIPAKEARDKKKEHQSREGQRAARAFERIKPPADLKQIPYINHRIKAIQDMDTAAESVAQSVNKYGIANGVMSLRESDAFKPGGKFYDLTHMLEDPNEMKSRLKRMAKYRPPDYKTSVDPIETYKADHRSIAKMYIPKEFYQFLPEPVVKVLNEAPRAKKPIIKDEQIKNKIKAYAKTHRADERKE